jgi:L-seryl-tRNA(Ser) seleniumtransferase
MTEGDVILTPIPQADGRDEHKQNLLAGLPAVHKLLETPELKAVAETVPAAVVADAARYVLEQVRRQILENGTAAALPDEAAIRAETAREAYRRMEPSLRRAINATGIVLHTGLGRARLAGAARDALMEVADAHSVLEIDRETGRRGSRRDHVRGLLCELTGAEDGTVVNNCAGAVFLAVTALAAGREVIISRGELVEIGGAFRMPDIISASGATLVEVGTTNRTRLADYAAAITESTGLILRCHPSNFAIIGFTEATPTEDLVKLGRDRGIPVMDDQGSGAILAPQLLGLPESKGSLRQSVASGCDLVTASGDKLLGGPQAGIILGKRAVIERIASHPLARALRVDKFTLAALEATLRLYRDPSLALREIPTLRYLLRALPELTVMAETLKLRLQATLGDRFAITLVQERSQVGGGSLPGEDLPTMCVSLRSAAGSPSPDEIAARLRGHSPPVFARIKADAVLLDPRTLEPEELDAIVDAAREFV